LKTREKNNKCLSAVREGSAMAAQEWINKGCSEFAITATEGEWTARGSI